MIDITPYKLLDEAFWESNERGGDRLANEPLGDFRGLLVDAPRQVPIDQRRTWPAAVYHLGRIRDVTVTPFDKFGLVTLMNVTDNRLHVATGRSFNKDTDVIDGPPVNPAKLPDGDMSATSVLELREGLKTPWEAGRYLLTALLRDQVSNRAESSLCRSAACFVDPEVEKYLAAERGKVNPGPISPPTGERLPSYRRQTDSLPVPAASGVQLTATRVSDQGLGQPVVIKGAFRLTPTTQEWVKPGWVDSYTTAHPGEPKPLAVVAVWLLVTGADDGSVAVFPLRLPCWARDGTSCTGQFALDLRQLKGAPNRPQTYFVYAFSGEHMAGPVASALVGRR